MKIIIYYIISIALTITFIDQVEMNDWEFTLFITTILSAVLYGKALTELDKKESK